MAPKKPQKSSKSKTLTMERPKSTYPPEYAVIILNDDFTPMDFVVHVIIRFFRLDETKATQIMLNVHRNGRGICGSYPKEIAETKASQVVRYSTEHEYPLQCIIEPK